MAVDFDSKLDMRISDEVLDEEGVDGHEATATDRRDMMRLGKTQELNVCMFFLLLQYSRYVG